MAARLCTPIRTAESTLAASAACPSTHTSSRSEMASSVPGAYVAILGPIALVSMNTEVDFRTGSPQWTWLDKALGSDCRTRTPWVLFAGHRGRGFRLGKVVRRRYERGRSRVDVRPKKPAFWEGNDGTRHNFATPATSASRSSSRRVLAAAAAHEVNAVFSGTTTCTRATARSINKKWSLRDRFPPGPIRELGPARTPTTPPEPSTGKPGDQRATCKDRIAPAVDSPGACSPARMKGRMNGGCTTNRRRLVSLVVGSAGAGFTRNSRLTKGSRRARILRGPSCMSTYLRVAMP